MTIGFIQARMGSTRLPGKVLKPIASGYSLLGLMLQRISASQTLDRVVVLTSDLPGDDVLSAWCSDHGVHCFRGSESDVLDRFYQAALHFEKPDTLVRLTADCVLHHSDVIDRVVNWYKEGDYDYFSNSNNEPDYLEDGMDVEVFSFTALEQAAKLASRPSDREHVTPFIKRTKSNNCGWRKVCANHRFKLSVDSPADFRLAQAIIAEFSPDLDFDIFQIVELLESQPELLEINQDSEINAGYKKSIEDEEPRIK